MKLCAGCRSPIADSRWHCSACGFEPQRVDGLYVFAPALAGESEGFEESFFRDLSSAEAGHFWFEGRNNLIAWALRRFFPAAASFLEVGCGTGFVISELQKRNPRIAFSGSEIFITGLEYTRERLRGADLFQMDATSIPFENEFDVVGAFDVVEHISADETALQNIYRAVKPGGGVILTVPQHKWLWSAVDDFSHHKRRYSRRELIAKMRAAGFRIAFATSFVSLLTPLMLLSRVRAPKRAEDIDPMAEFHINPAVNRALLAVMNVERALIERGVRFPAGGSLLAVGYKPAT